MLKEFLLVVESTALLHLLTSGFPLHEPESSRDILERLDELLNEYDVATEKPPSVDPPLPLAFNRKGLPLNLTSDMLRNRMPYWEYYDMGRCSLKQCFLCYDCVYIYAQTDVCYTSNACVSFVKGPTRDRAGLRRGQMNRDRGCADMHVRRRNYTLGEICLHQLYLGEILRCDFCDESWCNGAPNRSEGKVKHYTRKDAIRLLFGRHYSPRHSNNTPPPIPTLRYELPCENS